MGITYTTKAENPGGMDQGMENLPRLEGRLGKTSLASNAGKDLQLEKVTVIFFLKENLRVFVCRVFLRKYIHIFRDFSVRCSESSSLK